MRKKTKIMLLTATALLLLGGALFTAALAAAGGDFSKLSTVKYETATHEVSEPFTNISIAADTADILFVQTESDTAKVECYEQEKLTHAVSVADGTLLIEVNDTRAWYEHIGINFKTSRITVFLPKGTYGALTVKADTSDVVIPKEISLETVDVTVSTGDVACAASPAASLKIKTSTGDIEVSEIITGTIDLTVSTGEIKIKGVTCTGAVTVGVSTGDVEIEDLSCGNFTSTGSTGDLSMERVIVKEKLVVKRSTGDVELDGCDAAELVIETTTGEVEGTLLSGKMFAVDSDTGRKDVPESTAGGRCEITTDTGNIKIRIQ